MIFPTHPDASWSSGTMDVTTVLIESALPALTSFLKEMNDGFIGEGGDVSGDLYMERSVLKL